MAKYDPTHKPTFPARHIGQCGICGETFEPGELVTKYPINSFVHYLCDLNFDWSSIGI